MSEHKKAAAGIGAERADESVGCCYTGASGQDPECGRWAEIHVLILGVKGWARLDSCREHAPIAVALSEQFHSFLGVADGGHCGSPDSQWCPEHNACHWGDCP